MHVSLFATSSKDTSDDSSAPAGDRLDERYEEMTSQYHVELRIARMLAVLGLQDALRVRLVTLGAAKLLLELRHDLFSVRMQCG